MKHRVVEYKDVAGAAGLVVDVPGSSVVSLQVRFNSGFQFADHTKYEVPHVMEHLLATVTQGHPGANEFIIDAQKNGAYVNAMTSVDVNGYVYECADFELERILDLLEEQLTRPLFSEQALAAEVGNVREELSRNTTQHATVCSIRLAEECYPKLWLDYDRRIEQLPEITVADVEAHYHQTHTAANARFYVGGSFPDGGAWLAERLERIFRAMPRGKRLERSRDVGLGLKVPVVTKRDIRQHYYRVLWFFGELSADERRALSLMRMVLVGGMGARILGQARRRGLAYGVGGAGHAEPGNSSFGFSGFVTPANAVALFELIAREFAAVRRGDVREAELVAAKDLMIGSVQRSTQTVGDVLGWYIDPYDEEGEIRNFDQELAKVQAVELKSLAEIAGKAVADRCSAASFLGDLTKTTARNYSHILQS